MTNDFQSVNLPLADLIFNNNLVQETFQIIDFYLFLQVFFALSGSTGKLLWEFSNPMIKSDLMSVYVAQFIDDLNQDGIPEILAVHGKNTNKICK